VASFKDLREVPGYEFLAHLVTSIVAACGAFRLLPDFIYPSHAVRGIGKDIPRSATEAGWHSIRDTAGISFCASKGGCSLHRMSNVLLVGSFPLGGRNNDIIEFFPPTPWKIRLYYGGVIGAFDRINAVAIYKDSKDAAAALTKIRGCFFMKEDLLERVLLINSLSTP